MDIISEILETDRLAEEKLEQAKQQRSKMLEECEKQAEQLISDAKRQAEEYRTSLMSSSESGSAGDEFKSIEHDQLAALADAYEKNHEEWEKEIFAAIIG